MAMDAITSQVIRQYLETVSIEMSTTIERTSVHPLFNETHDYSTGVFYADGDEVDLVARSTAIPVHIFASLMSVRHMLDGYASDLHDGDVVILNDPYYGGTHSADWTVMRCVELEGGGMLFPSVRGHMADCGGSSPGGYNPSAREVWQEAFRLAPIKLVERGKRRLDIQRLILANTRIPDVLEGDLDAMVAACEVATNRITELVAKYGVESVRTGVADSLDYSERRIRAEVSKWPDGTYVGTALLDHDSAGSRDIKVVSTLTVSGSDLIFDFDGSASQTPGFINSPWANTASYVYSALCAAIPDDIPVNSGLFRAVTVEAPLGTVVNPIQPAAVMATTGRIGGEIGTAVMKSLEYVAPERVGAIAFGGSLCTSFGHDPRYDEFYVTIEYGNNLAAAGASHGVDGWGGWPTPFSTLVFNTIEMMEIQFPFLYHEYEFTTDTAAAGQWRGLPAFSMVREARWDDQFVNLIIEGVRNRAPGWVGGSESGENRMWIARGDQPAVPVIESATRLEMAAGDRLQSLRFGGGGWGDALTRDPEAVRTDVIDEIYSIPAAERLFGVVIVPSTSLVDVDATNRLRESMRLVAQPEVQNV